MTEPGRRIYLNFNLASAMLKIVIPLLLRIRSAVVLILSFKGLIFNLNYPSDFIVWQEPAILLVYLVSWLS